MDDPDELMQSAEPPSEPVIEAAPLRRRPEKGPYHEPIAAELLDDLEISIGQGLALTGTSERAEPRAIIQAIAGYLTRVFGGEARLSRDPSDAALALACLYGQALCREIGWGWAHLRRARPPGIVVTSADGRYVTGPRAVIDRALSERSSDVLLEHYEKLRDASSLPESDPGRYLRIR